MTREEVLLKLYEGEFAERRSHALDMFAGALGLSRGDVEMMVALILMPQELHPYGCICVACEMAGDVRDGWRRLRLERR